jgi:hypothetical protein
MSFEIHVELVEDSGAVPATLFALKSNVCATNGDILLDTMRYICCVVDQGDWEQAILSIITNVPDASRILTAVISGDDNPEDVVFVAAVNIFRLLFESR